MSEADKQVSAVESPSKEYVEDGMNKMVVKCKYCTSKMLDKKSGLYVVLEKELPHILQDKRNADIIQNETITEFYHVESMYTFDNIGFTHTVGNTKYLSCADCDAGPVGFYDMDTKHSYVAISRIEHVH